MGFGAKAAAVPWDPNGPLKVGALNPYARTEFPTISGTVQGLRFKYHIVYGI